MSEQKNVISLDDFKLSKLFDDPEEFWIEGNHVIHKIITKESKKLVMEDEPFIERVKMNIALWLFSVVVFIGINGAKWVSIKKDGLHIIFSESNNNFREIRRIKTLHEV